MKENGEEDDEDGDDDDCEDTSIRSVGFLGFAFLPNADPCAMAPTYSTGSALIFH